MRCPHCETDVDEHPANRCLDAWVAEAAMGNPPLYQATKKENNEWGTTSIIGEPMSLSNCQELCERLDEGFVPDIRAGNAHYSTSIAAAWEVVEKLKNEYTDIDFDGEDWRVFFSTDTFAFAPDVKLAICHAALKAVL